MARREVVRLGLFPELGYFQPPSLVENTQDGAHERSSFNGSGSVSARRKALKGTPSVSSRTVSPSVFSSSDLKEDVVAVLKRRFRTDRATTNIGEYSATRWTDRVSEIEMDAEQIWTSRKRKLDDSVSQGSQTDVPKAKNARTEDGTSGRNGNGEVVDTGIIAVAQVASKISSKSANGTPRGALKTFGLLEPDEVELDGEEKMDEAPVTDSDTVDRPIKHRTVLRPIYGRRRLQYHSVYVEEPPKSVPAADQNDEEEGEDALAAFRAGQEYEQRKLSNWMKSAFAKPEPEKRLDVQAFQAAITTSSGSSVVPAIILTAPSISSAASTAPLPLLTSTPSSSNGSEESSFPVPLAAAPTISLAPVTTVIWSTSLTTPRLAVQPFATSSTTNLATMTTGIGSNMVSAPFTLPSTMAPDASMSTVPSSIPISPAMSPADMSISVTIPLPVPKSTEGPSTSATLRLPTTSANIAMTSVSGQSGFNFNVSNPSATAGFKFTTSKPPDSSAYNFGSEKPATTSGFTFTSGKRTMSDINFSSGNASSSSGFNFTASDPPATSGFNFAAANPPTTAGGFAFSFTGQPTSAGNFNFASLDPASTNVFSAVGSAQSITRKKPSSTSSFLTRRRHR